MALSMTLWLFGFLQTLTQLSGTFDYASLDAMPLKQIHYCGYVNFAQL